MQSVQVLYLIYLNPTAEYVEGLQLYNYTQARVLRYGVEAQATWVIDRHWEAELKGEYLYAEQLSGDKKGYTLPFSTPWSVDAGAKYSFEWHGNTFVGLNARIVGAQHEIVPPEKPTDGHWTLNLSAGKQIPLHGSKINIALHADNLLDPHFIAEMNKAFACGNKVVTGYRNSKNIETNVLSVGYGIHFFANTACYHRPRAALGLGTHLTGTGYLFAADLLENGWHFTNLTEDDEFTIYITSRAKKIAFCEDAEFYDEQPVDVGTAFRQRNRWARGRIVAFVKHFRELVKFPFASGVGFTGYDIFWHYFPVGLATWVLGLIYPILSIIVSLVSTGTVDVLEIVKTVLAAIASTYAFGLVTGIIAVLRERKHIRCGGLKLFFYLLLSPWFLLADTVHNIVAVFVDVKWTKIDHIDDRKIDDLIPPKGEENNVH